MNNKGTDQSAHMHRLVCTIVVRKPFKTGFLWSRPIYFHISLFSGMVAASHLVKPGPKMISVPRSGTPTTIQLPVSSAHTGTLPPGLHSQIRGALLPQGLRAAAPPVNRPASPAVSIGTSQSTDIHR